MAKTYTLVGWEDGVVKTPAMTNLSTGEVTPAEIEGGTLVCAENLKHMDDAIKELYDDGIANITDKILNTNSNSTEDTYSCDYINKRFEGNESLGSIVVEEISCKNLLNVNVRSQTQAGVTFTVNSDGTIIANGTATANINFYINSTLKLNAGSYKLSGCTNGSSTTYRLVAPNTININGDTNFNLSSKSDFAVYINIKSGTQMSNVVFKPMIRLASITDNTYTSYKNFNNTRIYSSEEHIVAEFFGKTLYEKTIILQNGTSQTTSKIFQLSDFGISNVSEIFMTQPSYYSLEGYTYPFNYFDGSKYQVRVNNSVLEITVEYEMIANSKIVITLNYTKNGG